MRHDPSTETLIALVFAVCILVALLMLSGCGRREAAQPFGVACGAGGGAACGVEAGGD